MAFEDDAAVAPGTTSEEDLGEATGAGDGGTDDGGRSEADDFIENATAEELELIKNDPVLSKVHRSMLRDYKGKTTQLSQQRRQFEAQQTEYEQAKTLFDAIRDDPDGVISILAQRRGMTIAQATKEVAKVDDELTKLFGADAEQIRPTMETMIDKRAEAKVAPIIGAVKELVERQMKADIATDLKSFQNELKENGEEMTPEIEAEMVKLTDQLDPGPGISQAQYIRMLHRIATAGKNKAAVTREVTERMQKAARSRDVREVPSGGVSRSSGITDSMSLRESLRVAREGLNGRRG